MQNTEKNNLNVPQVGMQLSKNKSDLQPQEYSLLVNGDIESVDTSPVKITNEPSNLLCSTLKPNFDITGVLPVNPLNRTYYFLNNPITNESEIGWIANTTPILNDDKSVSCPSCDNQTQEQKPLESTNQIPFCTYNQFVSDSCLQFNITEPISATYRLTDRGIILFFAQPNKPMRYIEEWNVPYTLIPQDNPSGCVFCGDRKYSNQLDCNRIKIIKDYQDPCIYVKDVISGGKLNSGTYQFVVTYADERENQLTDFSNYSTPVSIYQREITINTDYETNKAVKLEINNLQQQFESFTLVVIETVNNISTSYIVGNFPITSSTFQYTYTGFNRPSEIQISPNELRRKRPVYTSAKQVGQSNDILFWSKLKEQRPINLQPVVNNLRIKSATIEAFEGFYSNPLSYNSTSYLRDEVYPFFIYFKSSNGYQTADFLISNNDAAYYESKGVPVNTVVNGINTISLKGCEDNRPNKYWQVYNAAPSGYVNLCGYSEETLQDGQLIETDVCYSAEWEQGEPEEPDCRKLDWSTDNCFIETLTPSGTLIVPKYKSLPDPPLTSPAPKEEQDEEILNDVFYNGYIPLNTIPDFAEQLYQGQNNQCGLSTNPTGNTTGGFPRAYFTSGVLINWFKIELSNPVATSIYALSSSNTPVKIEVFKQNLVDKVVDVVSNTDDPNDYFVIRNVTSSLNTGDTLYIKLTYSGTPNVWTNADGIKYDYANICVTQPFSNETETVQQNAVYRKVCNLSRPIDIKLLKDPTCFKRPAREYDFAYWESSLCYPNNPEVWGDLCGKPIRYHKFPEPKIAPLHSSYTQGIKNLATKNVRIYPIGIKLDIKDVKNLLNQAVQQGLLTEQEKLNITSFGIKRGNRRQNKSIIAKGLLYDVWKTTVLNEQKTSVSNSEGLSSRRFEYYPNYPYNDLNPDQFIKIDRNSSLQISHPYSSDNSFKNNRYTFHSPETSYNNPLLGVEFKIDSIEWGAAGITLSQVDDHAKYVLLTQLAVDVSEAIASGRIVLEASLAAFSAGSFSFTVLGTGTDLAIINFAIYLAIGIAAGFISNLDNYTIEQKEIFKNVLNPINYTYYYYSVGNYNNSSFIKQNTEQQRAAIEKALYLKPGVIDFNEFSENVTFNNFQRESSVYLSISDDNSLPNTFFKPPYSYTPNNIKDNSRVILSENNQVEYRNIVSYYGSIKNYTPDQYGFPDQIELVDTGYCGRIDWSNPTQSNDCEIIFGGDTYIGRHAFKRKFPYFLQDRVGFPEDTDVNYQEIGNIGYPNYWFNTSNTYLDPIRRPKDLARRAAAANLYQTTAEKEKEETQGLRPGTFKRIGRIYLYQYGIVNFICESDYNLDLRHGENDSNKNFYPNILNVNKWTQQNFVPVSEDNYYFYNTTFSKQLTENLFYYLKPFYNQEEENLKTDKRNRTHYSKQYFPLSYSANDFYDFPFDDGELTSLKGIEQNAVLVTQTNASKVFNAFIEIPATVSNIQVTSGSIFAQKPRQYYKTDLGFGGATQQQIVSTPYGHFFVDAENPAIFQVNSSSQKDITQDTPTKKVKAWFRENIPFNITKQFPQIDSDNPLNNIGFSLGWDNKRERLFITKLDYRLKQEYLPNTTYVENKFFYKGTPISLQDTNYFENKSWTVSYSPKTDQFISFFSFKPNFYNSWETYFQTIYNSPASIWNHHQTNQSYQVFNNELHPFIIEYGTKNQFSTDFLKSISYISEFRRYTDEYNYYLKQDKTFNKALIYTDNQTSGLLHLIPKQKNNIFQQVQYYIPKIKQVNGIPFTEILVDNIQNQYYFNQFQDRVNDRNKIIDSSLQTQFNTQPILEYTPNNPAYRELNPLSLNYNSTFRKNLINDYFIVRLINDQHSNYRIQLQYFISQANTLTQ